MNRVFVVQNQFVWDGKAKERVPKFDFVQAEPFGRVVLLLGPEERPTDGSVVEALHEKLHDFDDLDYLLPTGHPTLIGLATAIAADYNAGSLRMLFWSKSERTYIPVSFTNVFRQENDDGE